jgi:hypothetical protein
LAGPISCCVPPSQHFGTNHELQGVAVWISDVDAGAGLLSASLSAHRTFDDLCPGTVEHGFQRRRPAFPHKAQIHAGRLGRGSAQGERLALPFNSNFINRLLPSVAAAAMYCSSDVLKYWYLFLRDARKSDCVCQGSTLYCTYCSWICSEDSDQKTEGAGYLEGKDWDIYRKKFLLVVVMSLLAVSAVLADSPCPTGTNWQTYLNFNTAVVKTCSIGNLDFSNFSFTTGGTNPTTASAVGVNTLTTPGDEGFNFNPAIGLAGSNLTEDVSFDYTVTAIHGVLITDLSLFFNGSVVNNPGGTGANTSVTETQLGGTCTPSCSVFSVTNPPTSLTKNVVFNSPVTSLQITKDVVASTGTNGQAAISIVVNDISNTPEPRLISLLVMALLAALGLSKKFKSVLG